MDIAVIPGHIQRFFAVSFIVRQITVALFNLWLDGEIFISFSHPDARLGKIKKYKKGRGQYSQQPSIIPIA